MVIVDSRRICSLRARSSSDVWVCANRSIFCKGRLKGNHFRAFVTVEQAAKKITKNERLCGGPGQQRLSARVRREKACTQLVSNSENDNQARLVFKPPLTFVARCFAPVDYFL